MPRSISQKTKCDAHQISLANSLKTATFIRSAVLVVIEPFTGRICKRTRHSARTPKPVFAQCSSCAIRNFHVSKCDLTRGEHCRECNHQKTALQKPLDKLSHFNSPKRNHEYPQRQRVAAGNREKTTTAGENDQGMLV